MQIANFRGFLKMINIKLKLSTKLAILSFVLSLFGIAALGFISFGQANEIFKNNLVKNTSIELANSALDITRKVESAKKNLLFIRDSDPIQGILRTTRNKYNYDEEQNMHLSSWLSRLTSLFTVMMRQNPSFFQMRLIGVKDNGREIIRVQRVGDRVENASDNLVQKGSRCYYQESVKLRDKEIYISKIDLNKENNTISLPYTPTLRIVTPVYDEHKVFGILIVNIDIGKLLNFDLLSENLQLKTYITNARGEYLYHPNKEKTFGFEFGREYLIQNDFPLKDFFKSEKKSASFYLEKMNVAISITTIKLLNERKIYLMQTASSGFFKNESQNYIRILLLYSMAIALIIAVFIAILVRHLTAPITKLTDASKNITEGKELNFADIDIHTGDEVEELATSFKYMLDSLSKSKDALQNQAQKLKTDVADKTKELRELNEELEIKIEEALQENIKQLQTLQEQSKMASMGEMIGAIAHQWRQPLNAVSLSIQNLKYDYMAGDIDEAFIENYIEENKAVIKFMSKTIDDFRSFFRVDKEKKYFNIKETMESVVSMQSAQLKNHSITLEMSGDEFEYFGLQSEFQQVILNLINNAKDALEEKAIENPMIKIIIDKQARQILIQDNAGGVPLDIMERIFEPYFTSKEQGKGTGMGLYMSKMIIEENMDGKLFVRNRDDGACFYIDLSKMQERKE